MSTLVLIIETLIIWLLFLKNLQQILAVEPNQCQKFVANTFRFDVEAI